MSFGCFSNISSSMNNVYERETLIGELASQMPGWKMKRHCSNFDCSKYMVQLPMICNIYNSIKCVCKVHMAWTAFFHFANETQASVGDSFFSLFYGS